MHYYYAILFMLATAIAMSAIAPKIKVPYPIVLMTVGILLGFMPWFWYIPIEPRVVFFLFLPPLLYDSAVNISFDEFKKNIPTIASLAFTMVLITMTVIAIVAKYLIPDISWPAAFMIGAVLAPPDAVAASGILKEMNLSHRTETILEGESLVNDTSALTVYRIILGVITGHVFNIWEAGLEFIVIILGGAVIGVASAFVFGFIVRTIPWNSTVVVSLNVLLPFLTYSAADILGVSGIIAVAIMGIMMARQVSQKIVFADDLPSITIGVESDNIYAQRPCFHTDRCRVSRVSPEHSAVGYMVAYFDGNDHRLRRTYYTYPGGVPA